MMITGKLFVEMECCQFTKTGQNACGDDYRMLNLEEENRAIAVLSDGLGSGIKAHLLANMTTTMGLYFLKNNRNTLRSVETIMDTLPICEVRKISYATFSMVDLRLDGITRIVEMGNPQYIQLRGDMEIPPQKHTRIVSSRWPDRAVECYETRIEPGDRLIVCSDGVTQAGMGKAPYKFGWRRSGELAFIQDMIRRNPTVSAYDLANLTALQAASLDPNRTADDISCLVIYLRPPRVLRILTGPPFRKEHDKQFARLAAGGADAVIICGGTTVNIIERELKKRVEIDLKMVRSDDKLPPPGTMPGVGLCTEGILTLSKVCSILENGESESLHMPTAARAIINKINENDRIEFIVGTKVNEAHQDPKLPLELELRRNIVKRLSAVLSEKYRKSVIIKYF